jgi:DNA polymerase-3 subunit delta'
VSAIIGHAEPIAAFRAAMHGERLHHAWLLTGPEGVGKFSLAMQFARRLLAEGMGLSADTPGVEVPLLHPAAKLLDAWSHPDFALLDRLPKDDKLVSSKPRNDWPEDEERARSIKVDQVRGLNTMFATAPSMSPRRVIVVDEAETFEINAANALLKRLEEPPAGTIFLLVAHSPGRLLPTIRSRCRVLRFGKLDDAAMTSALRARLPDADPLELNALVAAGEGAPGKALRFAGLDIASIDAALADLAGSGDRNNALRLRLAQQLSGKAAQARYEVFLQRVPAYIAGVSRARSGDALGLALAQWEKARSLAAHAVAGSLDPQNVVFALAGHVAALAPAGSSAKA